MKLFILLGLFFNTHAMATTQSFDIECAGPNIHYINQFEMKATLEFDDELSENVTLKVMVKKAGYESENEFLELTNLKAVLERVYKPEVFGKAFYMIRIKSEIESKQKVFANIVLGYPGKMTSFLRLEGLRQYKSTCKLAE